MAVTIELSLPKQDYDTDQAGTTHNKSSALTTSMPKESRNNCQGLLIRRHKFVLSPK